MTVLTTDILNAETRTKASPSQALQAVNVTKRFDTRPVLDRITFELCHGEYLSLLGANGAGKSTLLSILATLTPIDSGEIYLFGQRIRHGSTQARQKIGLIGHLPMLYRDLSAVENLSFFAKLYGLKNAAERIDELLRLVALQNRAFDVVKTFSRGMVQRLAIARALLHDPQLLLADEPFAGLDVRSTRLLEQLLANISAAGKTVVLVNHDIDQSLRLSSRVIVLRHAKVQLDQSANGLTQKDLEQEVFGP